MKKTKMVAVLGTGWIGMALVKSLTKEGFTVRGSQRSNEAREGIVAGGGTPFYLDLPEDTEQLDAFLEGADALVITLPPRGRSLGDQATEKYLAAFNTLAGKLDGLHVVYTSSTGVYGGGDIGLTTEDNPVAPDSPSTEAVVAAEEWLMKNAEDLTILRLSGLIGPGRNPVNFFRNRDTVEDGDAPVNMVHREDVLSAISLVLGVRPKGIFNVCASTHPTKRAFYGELLRHEGLSEKEFLTGGGGGKRIDSTRLRELGWSPTHDELI